MNQAILQPKTGILIQSRLSSSRLPGKMLMNVNGVPLVEFVYRRCATSNRADMVAIVTSDEPSDDALHDFCRSAGIEVFRGPLANVLDRYVQAARHYGLDLVCRVCGDSPFADVTMMDSMFDYAISHVLDYVSFTNTVDGFLSEVIRTRALEHAAASTTSPYDREHVTPHIRSHPEVHKSHWLDMGYALQRKDISLTVDTAADLQFCNLIGKKLSEMKENQRFHFTSADIVSIINGLYPQAIKEKPHACPPFPQTH